ncbi:MAG TPA: glycoside hydrolase family 30 beta sandwich domain-containing protein [Polyangiaceae bacterium]|nr:glycoside hydrolase family 30 beta sandwich domain-containing protein [Polyangiaceae bacterium]
MKQLRGVAWAVGLSLWVAACGPSDTPDEKGTGGAGGATSNPVGGSSGKSGAGTSGGNGGTTGGSSGTGSGATGGAAGSGQATGGNATGGSSGSTGAVSGVGATAGSGMSDGGVAGTGAGGTPGTGGASVGGDAGLGPVGGSAGIAGMAGAGGSAGAVVVDKPPVVTSANGDFWKKGTVTMATSGTAAVTVSESGTQKWIGFGGTFNEAGWDALSALSDADKALAIKLLFDAADGAKFDWGRIPIGASDYAMDRYTLAETAGDYDMASFSLTRDQMRLIPYIKAALAVKADIQFWGSAWTPPKWLKTNNSYDAATLKNPPYSDADGMMKSDDQSLTAYALYLTKFVQEYGKLGINVTAVVPQNEPGYGNPYPSCYWPSDLYIKFVKQFLGPKLKTDAPNCKVWGGTMSAPGDGDIAVALSNDATAMQFVTGFGLQWNTQDKAGQLKNKGLVIQTEHKCGNYDFATDYWDQSRYDPNKPQNDFAYGQESWKLIRDWVKAGSNSYNAWNMVLDTQGTNLNATKPWHQNALLVVDRGAKKLIQTPAYYVFRHLSQYVQPNAVVVGASGGDALAFKNPDGSYVVVVYNEGAAKPGMIVAIGAAKLQFDMPGTGWATVNYKP